MESKLKFVRDCIYDFLDANLEKIHNNKDFKKFGVYVSIIGVTTLVGSIAIASTSPKLGTKKEAAEPVHDFDKAAYEINVNQESTIDFENYDTVSLNKFCDSACSLYESDDAIAYRQKYGEIVEAKAKKWGIDPNLAMAVLTQESRGGNTTNIMQINFRVWAGKPFRVYDFEQDKYVDILLTDDPTLYNNDKYLTINQANLQNESTNISIGLAMFQYSLSSMKYDIPAGCQCYNYGPTSMNNKVFPETYAKSYRAKEAILANQFDFSFMNYTYAYELGDDDYFYHISRFLDPNQETITVKEKDINGVTILHDFEYQKLIKEYKEYSGQIL